MTSHALRVWLHDYWRGVLGVDVPDEENPRRYGASSLAVVRMVTEVEDACGITLPGYVLMTGESVSRIVQLVERLSKR